MIPLQHPLFEALVHSDRDQWRDWRSSVDIDHIDAAGFHLLPMLAHRLPEWTAEDPAKAIFSGIARRAWTKNQIAFGSMLRAIDAANDCQLALSGLGACALRWSALGMARNFESLEFQVIPAQFDRAMERLQSAGWQQQRVWPASAAEFTLGAEGTALTLRAHSGRQDCSNLLWQGRNIRVVNRESLLCEALAGADDRGGLPWWCDARLLLREGAVEWRVVRARLRAHPSESHVRLRMLSRQPAALDIPRRMRMRPSRIQTAFEIIEDDYAASQADSFTGFLCARWRVRPWQLPWAILSRLLPPGTLAAIAP